MPRPFQGLKENVIRISRHSSLYLLDCSSIEIRYVTRLIMGTRPLPIFLVIFFSIAAFFFLPPSFFIILANISTCKNDGNSASKFRVYVSNRPQRFPYHFLPSRFTSCHPASRFSLFFQMHPRVAWSAIIQS